MDASEVTRLKALVDSIPQGEYQGIPGLHGWTTICVQHGDECVVVAEVSHIAVKQQDGTVNDRRRLPEFYAAAPQAIRALLAEVAALEAEVERLRGLLARGDYNVGIPFL